MQQVSKFPPLLQMMTRTRFRRYNMRCFTPILEVIYPATMAVSVKKWNDTAK